MKITSDSETLAENKVLILYVLSCVHKPITNDTLYTIISSAIDLNYFYFEQFLLDLIEVKYVICYEKDSQKLYKISESGKQTLDLTLDILPGIVKLKVDTNLKSKIEDFELIFGDFRDFFYIKHEKDLKKLTDICFELKNNNLNYFENKLVKEYEAYSKYLEGAQKRNKFKKSVQK